MKIPKEIVIAGVTYKIKVDPKEKYGGKFDAGEQVIYIGNKSKPDYMFQVFIHEVLEAIITERNHRYEISGYPNNEHFLFNFNHDEFDNICKDLAFALRFL